MSFTADRGWGVSTAGYYQSIFMPRRSGFSSDDDEAVVHLPPEEWTERVEQSLSEHVAEEPIAEAEPIDTHDLARLSDLMLGLVTPTLKTLRGLSPGTRLNTQDRIVLEAVALATARPSLFVRNGTVDLSSTDAKAWAVDLTSGLSNDTKLCDAFSAVGRIGRDFNQVGTGFLVAPNVVMTNRHVLRAIAEYEDGKWSFRREDTFIDFCRERGAAPEDAAEFKIVEVLEAGTGCSEEAPNFDYLDLAILRVETMSPGPNRKPLSVAKSLDGFDGKIYVLGFPNDAGYPQAEPAKLQTLRDAVQRLFGPPYGVKRIAPGMLSRPQRLRYPDQTKSVAMHDASTLAGSSGSCLLSVQDPSVVVGLHFAGEWLKTNYAHALHLIDRLRSNYGINFVEA
jgi:hypothetical protein